MNIWFTNKPSPEASGKTVRRSGSWRHAIFKRVVSPSTPEPGRGTPVNYPASTPVSSRSCQFRQKRSKREIRELWKSAINQQIILIRMEKQNLRLKAKQQEADVKRLKLSYQELGTCDEEASDTWDLIMGQAQSNPTQKCDIQLLNSAILRGIPKHKRGQVWQFFMQQRKMGTDQSTSSTNYSHINLDIPYEQLLRQLTSQQHAILIDLGRTFPSHQYFSSPLGSGQLALFNILKAYSLLDTDVGYCQGLSFVVGLLLMHYEEEDAFSVLNYMMFNLGAREHYKPDMLGLQVKLYQLTRLIHDQDPDIQLLLYHNDVLPSLYAAPWFLTMFASQFPVGFAVRVLDLVMLHGVDVIAKFALAIVLDHKKELMQCNGLEQVMECFKTVVTQITSTKLDRYLRKVIDAEWDKQMLTYAVEYSVMNDEAFNTFLSESSAPQMPVRLQKSVSVESKMVQTENSRETSPTNTGESHPILGELIQRQNAEISKLKQEKAELRKDIQTLLSCVLTMQKLAKISSKGAICPPVPPQVTDIASKYVAGGANYFSSMMENGWSSAGGEINSSSAHRETLKVVEGIRREEWNGWHSVIPALSEYHGVDDNGSSHGIPPLDQDSDDNSSDHSSHHITFEKSGASRVGISSSGSHEKLTQNNNVTSTLSVFFIDLNRNQGETNWLGFLCANAILRLMSITESGMGIFSVSRLDSSL
ncbi:TBC1 domain family member 1 [Orchesella cincta]|uniref:TBC1 domain family member 1 n=1 Tax=Orchesella cincta TaxID=48709 RepID=A0A1D2M3I4_ORCCI|nr:TBC1 domain family member 1 [Orchesella cincta]